MDITQLMTTARNAFLANKYKRAEPFWDIKTNTYLDNILSSLIGDLSGNTNIVVPLDLTGEAEILAEGLDLTIESEIERSPEGSARVSTLYCASSIRAVEVW